MDFTIEPRDYNVAEFYDHFNNDLPKVVKVTQGFYGEIVEDTFDRDQMMRIHAVSRQKRVVARMTQGNHTKLISIPLNYNEKFCVVKHYGKAGKEKDIYTILEENTLPLMVQFPKDHSVTVGNIAISTNHIPPMELLNTFEEVYLLGNFITDGFEAHLLWAMRKKRAEHLPYMMFHHNAPFHRAASTQTAIHQLAFELLDHPPNSPDLLPCHFFLFSVIKSYLSRRAF